MNSSTSRTEVLTSRQAAYTAADLSRVVTRYEDHYRMTSDDFLVLWRAKQLDHGDFELSRWALLLGARERATRAETKLF